MILAPLYEFFIRHLLSLFDSNKCLWSFSPLLVRYSRNATFKDIRVGDDDGFKRDRRDVFTACEALV